MACSRSTGLSLKYGRAYKTNQTGEVRCTSRIQDTIGDDLIQLS